MARKKNAPGAGGARDNAGRKPLVKNGIRQSLYLEKSDLAKLKSFKIESVSEFYRTAGQEKLARMEQKQQKLALV